MTSADSIDEPIRAAQALGDHDRAVTLTIEAYGREVLSFLFARIGEDQANDVFSDFLEDVWKGFPGFAWRSSLRTWVYTLARHAMVRHVQRPHRKRERFATSSGMAAMVEQVRSSTALYLKTQVKDRIRELRKQLPEDDQTVLLLRIDRKLAWRELALVMAEPGLALSESEIVTDSARLRTQFGRAKERLKRLAQAEGLLPDDDD